MGGSGGMDGDGRVGEGWESKRRVEVRWKMVAKMLLFGWDELGSWGIGCGHNTCVSLCGNGLRTGYSLVFLFFLDDDVGMGREGREGFCVICWVGLGSFVQCVYRFFACKVKVFMS